MKELPAFPEPRFNRGVHLFTRVAGGLYLRLALGITGKTIVNRDRLKREIASFKAKEQRLILAFRHTAVEDAPSLLLTVKESHLTVLYGRDVLNWAGKITHFLFPRLGLIAVQNRGSDRKGVTYLRKEAAQGRFPIALAPEGQVTYHAHRCGPIEAGVSNLALWSMENGLPVTVLPVAIGYQWTKRTGKFVVSMLKRWEEQTGKTLDPLPIKGRLTQAYEMTLALIAERFQLPLAVELPFIERRDALCRDLLSYAEALAGIEEGEGSILDRLFRLRFVGEDTLFAGRFEKRSPVEEAQQQWEMDRARLYLTINQIVDIVEYLDISYFNESFGANRLAESALNILDVINRLRGGTINSRYSPRGKRVYIQYGEPIRIEAKVDNQGRKQRLQAISSAVKEGLDTVSVELESSLEKEPSTTHAFLTNVFGRLIAQGFLRPPSC